MLGPLPWHYHRRYVAASANWVGAAGAPSRPVFMQKDIGDETSKSATGLAA